MRKCLFYLLIMLVGINLFKTVPAVCAEEGYHSKARELYKYLEIIETSREERIITEEQYRLLKKAILSDIETGRSTLEQISISDDPSGTWGKDANRQYTSPRKTSDTAYKTLRIKELIPPDMSLGAVAIIPFDNASAFQPASDLAYDEVRRIFKDKRYYVISRRTVERYMSRHDIRPGGKISDAELKTFSSELKVRYIISGNIDMVRVNKRFNPGGALLSVLGGGWTAYGTTGIETRIYDRQAQKIVWEKSVTQTRKNQFFGLLSSKRSVRDRAFYCAIESLFEPYFEMPNKRASVAIMMFDNVSEHPINIDTNYERTKTHFEEHNYYVISREKVEEYRIRHAITSAFNATDGELEKMAMALGVQYVVTGNIKHVRANSRFSLGGALISPLAMGWTAYGSVIIEASIFDLHEKRTVWKNQESKTTRNQAFGLLSSDRTVRNRAFDIVIKYLFKPFFQEQEHASSR